MGPDGCAGTTVSFTITGIDDIYLVNKSVVIPVVLLPVVNAVFHYFNGLMNHFARMFVVSLRIIAAIVAVLLRYGDGTHDVERQFKLAFALGVEIIIHRPYETAFLEILFISDTVVEGAIVGCFEFFVGEIDQNDQCLLGAEVRSNLPYTTTVFFHSGQPLSTTNIGSRTACLCLLFHSLCINFCKVFLIGDLNIGISVFRQPEMTVFITYQSCLHGRTVFQGNGSRQTTLRGNG